jgi:PAS domain S-box-containing protein
MPLRLKTRFTLTTTLLVLAVAALMSAVYVARLVRQVVGLAGERAEFVTQQIFLHAQQALGDAADAGQGPGDNSPEAVREYVRRALEENSGLTSLIEASVGYSQSIYEVTISDHLGVALISSDATLPGRAVTRCTTFTELERAGFLQQMRVLYGPARVYELSLPFDLGGQPFGEIRVALSTALLRNEIDPVLRTAGWAVLAVVLGATLLAAVISHASLAPLARISAQLDSIARGESAPAAVRTPDELGRVSSKISELGQQLRGVQQIFSTLRENVEHVMAGLDEGLILFTAEGRAVLVSPAAEKFLGKKAEQLVDKTASEVFPPGHPLRKALRIGSGPLVAVAPVEALCNGAGKGTLRVHASVQVIQGSRGENAIGALVTLRDAESRAQLDSHLQVSERLAALGRVTAGVAHEVKNPLNSMRLWLENLKQGLPTGDGPHMQMNRQAVQILDSEIDRLDRVVKTFLDFSRPVELEMAEVEASHVLRSVAAVAQPQFDRAGVELQTILPGDTVVVRGDSRLLQQALLNLVLNALEAICGQAQCSLKGRVTLAAVRQGSQTVWTIADNGPGIPPEHRAKIFQLYFTTRPTGTGIGLATAFRIAQLHGGTLDFQTETGRGTTFLLELPRAESGVRIPVLTK